jgi:prepilin-type N-terminal cleavage/methylation domain-containing protein
MMEPQSPNLENAVASCQLLVAGNANAPHSQLATRKQPATSNQHPATRHSGFTIIELLVVIGIILILIGLFFAGAKVVTSQARERDTKNMLETCKTMFENYRQATKLARYPVGISFGPSGTVSTTTNWYTAQEPAIGSATSDALGLSNNGPMPASPSQILTDTVLIYSAIESLPQNQTIIANLPANKKINIQLAAGTTVSLPLDGWGNPILFVPGGGLGVNPTSLVWLDGANAGIVTSTGLITPSSSPYNLGSYPPAVGTPSSNQPFFVSAGPDGDLSNAHGWTSPNPVTSSMTDDNIYSFQ